METKKTRIPYLNYIREVKATLPDDGDVKMEVSINVGDPYGRGYCKIDTSTIVKKKNNPQVYQSHYGYSRRMTENEVANYFPDLLPIVKVDDCTTNGVPIRYVNFLYYFEQMDLKSAQSLLRCSDEEFLQLSSAGHEGDIDYLTYLIVKIGLVDKWKKEADEAIKAFNSVSGHNFIDPYGDEYGMNLRKDIAPKMDYYARMEKEGAFTIEGIAARRKLASDQRLVGERGHAIADYVSDVNKLKVELSIRLAMLEFKIFKEDYIYYEHNNHIVINWRQHNVMLEQFNYMVDNIDMGKLPPNVQIIYGDRKRN